MKPIIIDFTQKTINESFIGMMFGSQVEAILGALFDGRSIPVTVKGTESEIKSFANTIGREKDYMQTIKSYGLDNPATYKNKFQLDQAISGFERTTGIKWPLR